MKAFFKYALLTAAALLCGIGMFGVAVVIFALATNYQGAVCMIMVLGGCIVVCTGIYSGLKFFDRRDNYEKENL